MTCREKLAKEHPEYIDPNFGGGCQGCPYDYGYLPRPGDETGCHMTCTDCWDREISETTVKTNIPWDEIRKLVDDAMEKKDRTVSISFNAEAGLTMYISPYSKE